MTTERLDIAVRQRGAKKTAAEIKGIGGAARAANKGIALLTAGIAGIAAIGVARQVIGLANSYAQLSNKVKVAVGEQGDLNGTIDELFAIADRTRGPVDALVQLYQRGSLAANELGASQQDLLEFTETVGTALALQGGAASEASGALLQLSQSLGSGIVRAEEFNSILEGAFPIARAAAKGIDEAGGSVAKLRQLVIEGKISSDVFFKGILSQGEDLKRQFANIAPTVDQAMTRIKNAFIQAAGSGNLDPLVDSLNDFADVIADPGFQQAFGAFVSGIVTIASKGVQTLATIGEFGQGLGIAIARFQGFQDAEDGVAVLTASIEGTVEEINEVKNALDGFSFKRGLLGEYNQAEDQALLDNLETRLASLTDARDRLLKNAGSLDLGAGSAGAAGPDRGTASITGGGAGGPDPKLLAQQQNFLAGLKTQNEELAIQAMLGDNAAAALARYATEQEIIALQLGPAQAESARALTEQIIAQNQAIEDQGNLAGQAAFIEQLEQQEERLRITAESGEDAAAALLRYDTQLSAAATGGGPEFVQLALDIADGITAQNLALEEQQRIRSDESVLDGLKAEAELIGLTNRERAIELELRRLSADATLAQRDAVAELAGKLFDENEALRKAGITFDEFLKETARSIQNTLGGALSNAVTEGFDELPGQFAKVLLDLTSQYLASEIFKLLAGIGQGQNSGGFAQAVGGFFAGGFATGGDFSVPGSGGVDSQLVAFKATPGENVSVRRPGDKSDAQMAPVVVPAPEVNVINALQDSDVVSAFNRGGGGKTVLNFVTENAGSFRQALGIGN